MKCHRPDNEVTINKLVALQWRLFGTTIVIILTNGGNGCVHGDYLHQCLDTEPWICSVVWHYSKLKISSTVYCIGNCICMHVLTFLPWNLRANPIQYIPRNMHTVFALLCFVVVIHWLVFPYPSGLLHWHCGNLTIAPVPAKQPWWIWINTSYEFIMNDCITTTKQSTTKPCAHFLGYTVHSGLVMAWLIFTRFYNQCSNDERKNI